MNERKAQNLIFLSIFLKKGLPAGRSVSEWIRNSTKPNVDFEFIEDGTPIACRYPTPWSGCQNFINTNSCAGFIERMDKIYWKSRKIKKRRTKEKKEKK